MYRTNRDTAKLVKSLLEMGLDSQARRTLDSAPHPNESINDLAEFFTPSEVKRLEAKGGK